MEMTIKILLSILEKVEFLSIVHYFGLLGYKKMKPGEIDKMFFETGVAPRFIKEFSYLRREKGMTKLRNEIREKKIDIDRLTKDQFFKDYLGRNDYPTRKERVNRERKPLKRIYIPKEVKKQTRQDKRSEKFVYKVRMAEFLSLMKQGKSALEIRQIMKIDQAVFGKLQQKADVDFSNEITPEEFFNKWKTN